MTRGRFHALGGTLALGFAAMLALGVVLWARWGPQVWLDAAIAYCF